MPVFVTMTVRPLDPARFEATLREFGMPGPADGAGKHFVGRREGDPGLYIIGGEWESHEAMHRYTDRVGEAFNARAGTEGVEWETQVWEIIG